jgi:hypothetical protein
LDNEEVHNSYPSPHIIRLITLRRVRGAGHVARTGERRIACGFFGGKPEGKRSLGRPRRRWVNNIKIDLERHRMGWYGLDPSG